jgi:hypothetical protein
MKLKKKTKTLDSLPFFKTRVWKFCWIVFPWPCHDTFPKKSTETKNKKVNAVESLF